MAEFNQWHIEEIQLDLDSNTQGAIPIVYGRQGDKDGILCNIELTQQGTVVQQSWFNGKRIFYEARGNGVSVRKQVDAIEGNVVKVVIPQEVFNNIGLVNENFLRVEDATTGYTIISATTSFKVYVRQGNLDPEASNYYLEEIEDIVAEFQKWFIKVSNTINSDAASQLSAKVNELEMEKVEVTEYDQNNYKIASQLFDRIRQGQNESITMSMLASDIKAALNEGVWEVVVNTSDIEDGAIKEEKLDPEVSRRLTVDKTDLTELATMPGYLGTTGVLQDTSDVNWKTSDFFEMLPTDEVQLKATGHNLVGTLCFYDSQKVFISAVHAEVANELIDRIVSPPENVMFGRLSINAQEQFPKSIALLVKDIRVDIERINSSLDILKEDVIKTVDLLSGPTSFGYIGLNDTIMSPTDTNWSHTEYISVIAGNSIKYKLQGHAGVASVSFYSEPGTFPLRRIVAPGNVEINGSVEVREGENFVRITAGSLDYSGFTNEALYYASVRSDIDHMGNQITELVETVGEKQSIPYLKPYKIYTVANDVVPEIKGHNRNYSAAIYLDHLFNGLTKELNIRFSNLLDKVIFNSPIKVIDANEGAPAVTYNNGVAVFEQTKEVGITGRDILDSKFNVIHASTLNSATKNIIPRVLTIGDSITYGELATVSDDNYSQNWAYHLMCKELFMKDNLDSPDGGYDINFLGQFKKERIMNYKGSEHTVTTYHEGIRGISLASYLNGSVEAFRSSATGKFSINAWLDRYRTLDDSGNRLSLGNGTGSMINNSNLNTIDVGTPTHVVIMLGANGGGTIDQYRELVNIIKSEYPDMIVGITVPDSAGTYFPSLHPNTGESTVIWNDNGDQGSRHNQMYNLASTLQNEFGNTASESNGVFFLPFYFTQPTAESAAMRKADLPDAQFQLTRDNYFMESYGWHPTTHVNGIGHTNWGYQLYSWLKYTIAKRYI